MKQIGTGFSFGKIIFMGEHAVVYGYPAIAIPAESYQCQVRIKRVEDNSIIESPFYHGLVSSADESLSGIIRLMEVLVQDFPDVLDYYELSIDSGIPMQRGLGSSAAVTIASIRAFFDLADIIISEEDVLSYAKIAEDHHHGQSSGLDAMVIAKETPIYFEKNQAPKVVEINFSAYLVVIDTGILGDTKEAVDFVREQFTEYENESSQIFKELDEYTQLTRYYLEQGNGSRVGVLMTSAHRALNHLGVSCIELDQCVTVALESGAWGAKMTGAGFGGCAIALCENLDVVERVRKNLYDYESVYFRIGSDI